MANQPDCSEGSSVKNLRNVRYCEVIPVTQQGDTNTSWIYNTLCLNDCPEDQWNDLTEAEAQQEYSSEDPNTVGAKKNGPRYWVMDQLDGSGSSTTGKTFTFGGIKTLLRATLDTKVGQDTVGTDPWITNQVKRDTVYTYRAGQLIYKLTTDKNQVYIMQSYSQQVEPLTIEQLPSLATDGKITLPTGWTYLTEMLTQDLVLKSNGLATIINDDCFNTYQMVT